MSVEVDLNLIDHIVIGVSGTANGVPQTMADEDKKAVENRVDMRRKDFIDGHKDYEKTSYLVKELDDLNLLLPANERTVVTHFQHHFFIRVDGIIEIGRQVGETSCHVDSTSTISGYTWNEFSVGVCLAGADKFTLLQWDSLTALVRELTKCALPKGPNSVKLVGAWDVQPGLDASFNVARWVKLSRVQEQAPKNHLPEHLLILGTAETDNPSASPPKPGVKKRNNRKHH